MSDDGRPDGDGREGSAANGEASGSVNGTADAGATDGWEGEPSLIDFPAAFEVKAMGLDEPGFEERVRALVEPHIPAPGPDKVTRRASSGGKYVSVRVHFTATGKAQLEAIYGALRREPRVLFTL